VGAADPKGDNMFLLNISYKTHPSAVEPHAQSHGAWVKKHIASGDFLIAGPKKSGLGGIIVARALDRMKLQALLNEDSFVQADVADYEIIDFASKLAASAITGVTE
jgi:uncharacterized protein YciI